MEHPDLAQFAALVAAAGALLMLAGRGRRWCWAAWGCWARPRRACWPRARTRTCSTGWPPPPAPCSWCSGWRCCAAAAAVLVRRPGWLPVVMILAAPLRPPIAFDSGGGFPLSVATGGQLGRLLPLYFVLAAAALALVWRAFDGTQSAGAVRALPRVVALPAAAFTAFAVPVGGLGRRAGAGGRAAVVLHDPVRGAAGRAGPVAVPRHRAARHGRRPRRPRHRVRRHRAVPGGHARAVLLRAQPGGVERELRLLPRDLAVRRPQPVRPPRGAGHDRAAGVPRAARGSTCGWASACWWCCGWACSSPTRSRAWWRWCA